MASNDFERLANGLNARGWPWWVLSGGEGGRIVVAERGARVLGIFASPDSANGLWVNPSLLEAGNEWSHAWNSGGDRTWLAPEVRIFIDRTGGEAEYGVQPGLDPGRYQTVRREEQGIAFLQETTVRDHEHAEDVSVSIERAIAPIPSPFHEKAAGMPPDAGVDFAGYELRVALRIHGDYGHPLGIWNLIQVPAPGTIIVPTWFDVDPTVIFGDSEPVVRKLPGKGVGFAVDGKNRCKISIPAVAAAGRLGYRHRLPDGRSGLLVRNFVANPSATHIDVPWEAPDDRGYAVQCYADDGEIGAFGEMECHAGAIRGPGDVARTDISQTWYFTGPNEQIDAIAVRLLGTSSSV